MHRKGEVREKDLDEAIAYYAKACDSGVAIACRNVGKLYGGRPLCGASAVGTALAEAQGCCSPAPPLTPALPLCPAPSDAARSRRCSIRCSSSTGPPSVSMEFGLDTGGETRESAPLSRS